MLKTAPSGQHVLLEGAEVALHGKYQSMITPLFQNQAGTVVEGTASYTWVADRMPKSAHASGRVLENAH